MKHSLFILLLLVTSIATAQQPVTYNALSAQAFSALQQNQPRAALKYYRKAFKLKQDQPLDILRAAVAATLARKSGIAADLLDHGFRIAPVDMAILFREQREFEALQDEPIGDNITKRTINASRTYQPTKYQPLIRPGEFEVSDQEYAFNASLAHGLLQRGDYKRALTYYQQAFKIKDTNTHSLLRAGMAAALSGQEAPTHQYLAQAFSWSPAYTLTYVRLQEDFSAGMENSIFLKAVQEQIELNFPDFDPALTSFIDEVWAEFHQYRQYNAFPKVGFQTKRAACTAYIADPELLPQKEVLTNLTYNKLDSLFSLSGIPGMELIADRYILLYAMFRGASTSFLDKYWPEIIAGGEVPDFRFYNNNMEMARVYDTACIKEGKKQRYGTIYLYPKEVRKAEPIDFWPVEDPENMAERRKALGLVPQQKRKFRGNIRFDLEAQLSYQGFPTAFELFDYFYEPYPIDPTPVSFSTTTLKN